MAVFLHTADLHLSADHPGRWDALDALAGAAADREADAVLVAGDLLDRGGDHAALRARVREALDAFPCPVVLLPGNHDRAAYAPGQDWGGEVRLLLDEPLDVLRLAGVRIVGVPFPADPSSFAGLRERVAGALAGADGPALLALHGTLIDARDPHIQAESDEDEPDDRYFPIRTGELAGLEAAYVALGHYHQHDLRREGGVVVAYAGSPTPIGSHALGPRSAVLVRLEGGEAAAERVRLPLPYRDRVERWLTPFEEGEELDALEQELASRADAACTLEVELNGILAGIGEGELRERTDAMAARLADAYAGLGFELKGVGLDPALADLFGDFRRRLEAWEGEEGPPDEAVRTRALELAARALKA